MNAALPPFVSPWPFSIPYGSHVLLSLTKLDWGWRLQALWGGRSGTGLETILTLRTN